HRCRVCPSPSSRRSMPPPRRTCDWPGSWSPVAPSPDDLTDEAPVLDPSTGSGIEGAERSGIDNVAVPEAMVAVPEAMVAVPEAMVAVPEALDTVPEALDAVPEALDTVPEPV